MSLSRALVVLFFMAIMVFTEASAEYRVYQYTVRAKNPYSMDTTSHIVTSTLDPESYVSYHGGWEMLKIDLVRSWMCYGDTSNRQVCKPPLARGNTNQGVN
jgi:hypothetical protein